MMKRGKKRNKITAAKTDSDGGRKPYIVKYCCVSDKTKQTGLKDN